MGTKRVIKKASVKEQTIQEAFDEFIDEKEALNKSAATIRSYQGSFIVWEGYLIDSGRSLLVKDIDEGYILAFCQANLNENMKPTTLNHYVRDMRSFIYWCQEHQKCKNFKIKMVQEQEVIKETYSEEELTRMLERPRGTASFAEWRTWAVVNWILATGNRAATVCNVLIGDVDFKKREIYINKTKNRKATILPLSPALANCLNEYMRRWRADSALTDYMFPNVGDEALTVNALKQSLRKYNAQREVSRTSIHALRHTFAKMWVRNTGDVFRLQKILGHKTLEMTRRYVNMFDEELKTDFETYSPLDKLKKNKSRVQKVKRSE